MTSYKEGIPCVFIIMCFPVFVLQDFSGDLSDLDGVVQQRRQEMMESSSSGSIFLSIFREYKLHCRC